MKEMLDKIDAFITKIEEASLWGYVKSVINKIKELLAVEGEEDAITFIDIMTK